jgi:protein-disulfide isomerase
MEPVKIRNQDFDYVAHVLGASLIVAALIISGTMLYMYHSMTSGYQAVMQAAGQYVGTAAGSNGGSAPSGSAGSAAGTAAAPAAAAAPGAPVNIALKANVPYLGSSSAKVTVVEYADYECPYCEKFFTDTWPDIYSKYVKTGKIKFIYQDFAFLGPDSNTAAEASHCAADQSKFWQYHDYLFSHQGAEGSGWATADHQKEFAQAVGLNTSQFNSCLDSGKYKQEVLDETAAGKTYGVSGTPSVFVNGVILVGAQPTTTFEQAIDAALAK